MTGRHTGPVQRLQALEARLGELLAWRNALELDLSEWRFAAPGEAALELRLGEPWPVVDGAVRGGPVVFEAASRILGDFAGRPAELELDVGGEGLVQVWLDGRVVASGGLNPHHRAFALGPVTGGERLDVRVEAVPKGPYGRPHPAPRLGLARLVAPQPEVRALALDLTALLSAACALNGPAPGPSWRPVLDAPPGHEAVPHLLAAAEGALRDLPWPTGEAAYASRLWQGSMGQGGAEGVWNAPRGGPAPWPLDAAVLVGQLAWV